ncbi:DUF4124 domain-containing protein [Usitatibacter palustris]|uniref:DUF4124 domain-containing protein n=1 Tax=Usitatibacter palustris TaxID=2732487 RepID=A0A6M4H301_9PROT|nr:DUF4124 domain-containing protein [Usitatibacter palustris]QJR13906.1 hypothetical protein DSM104440_00696 [Usitatibacter palustris]
MLRSERCGIAAVFAALLAFPFEVPAQTMYKLVDRAGKVSYSDKVPKNFDGQVTPIETDPANVQPAPLPAAKGAPKGTDEPKADMNAKRRAQRERLQAAIDAAHERLDKAKAALASGVDPKEDEYQTIQQKYDGSAKAGPRSNCMKQTGVDGKTLWICPTIVPGEAYRDRIAALEAEVAAAEAELTRAQNEYRRNVD